MASKRLAGNILPGLAAERRVLLILFVVQLYYLLSHAPFGIDYRYVLPMHYFLFVLAAATFYLAGRAMAQAARSVKRTRKA